MHTQFLVGELGTPSLSSMLDGRAYNLLLNVPEVKPLSQKDICS